MTDAQPTTWVCRLSVYGTHSLAASVPLLQLQPAWRVHHCWPHHLLRLRYNMHSYSQDRSHCSEASQKQTTSPAAVPSIEPQQDGLPRVRVFCPQRICHHRLPHPSPLRCVCSAQHCTAEKSYPQPDAHPDVESMTRNGGLAQPERRLP